MKNNIWIVPIEPIDQRYTKQWFDNIPKIIESKNNNFEVVTIASHMNDNSTTKGAFLNFADTNSYKARQVDIISSLFKDGKIIKGDRFLVTDAWNFAVIAIRYMSELLDIPVEIHSIWHAGAYDPTDILGKKMSKPWPQLFEQSVFHASTFNYFATNFHAKMFQENLSIIENKKIIVSGQPHDEIVDDLIKNFDRPKENIIVWPHRYNSDKQPEIIEILKTMLPNDYKIIITQNLNLSKNDYYDLLSRASLTFSCSLHENLGISMMEATLSGSIPLVPNRASYTEMYIDSFKYPSLWTKSLNDFEKYSQDLVHDILHLIEKRPNYLIQLKEQAQFLINNFMKADKMINNLVR